VALNKKLMKECKSKLLECKADLLNRVQDTKQGLYSDEKGGDEGDQTMRALAEAEMLQMADRLRRQLMEIEYALARIDNGNYGVCEETDELIEIDRLKAIPWTRLSIEGAEIRESIVKRRAMGGRR